MPPKIRELKADMLHAGFVHDTKAGKGSHTKMRDPDDPANFVLFSGGDGDDALPRLIKQVQTAIARRTQRAKEES